MTTVCDPARCWLLLAPLFALLLMAGNCNGGNQAPVAPVLTLVSPQSTRVQGTISACTDDGKPAGSSCTHEVFAVLVGAGPDAPPVAGPLGLPPSGGEWFLAGLTPDVTYDIYGRASDTVRTSISAPLTVTTNTAPAAPVVSVTAAPSTSISGTIDLCVDDALPIGTCARFVFAVADGAGPSAAPVAGPVQVSAPNTTWTLPGLTEGAVVDVYGRAYDGELEAFSALVDVTTNSRPAPPALAIPADGSTLGVAPTAVPPTASASGTVSSCVDDGGVSLCTQEIRVLYDFAITVPGGAGSCSNTPSGQCTCTGTVRDIAAVAGGAFATSTLEPGRFYQFYPVSKDGEFEVCGSKVSRMMPEYQAGCWKSEAGVFFPIPAAATGRGASIRWSPQELLAPDEGASMDGGNTLVSVIVALGDAPFPTPDPTGMTPYNPYNLVPGTAGYVESGTYRGSIRNCDGGTPGNYYFAQSVRPTSTPGVFFGTTECQKHPTTGDPYTWVPGDPNERFFAGSCEFGAPGFGSICVGEPSTTVYACTSTKCLKIANMQAAGTQFFTVGLEATCGNSSSARIVRHLLKATEYRDETQWKVYNAATGTPFEAARVGLPTGPVTGGMAPDFSDPFRLRLCYPGSTQELVGWLNDPALVQNCF